jgi:hypothetical protein
VNRICDFSNSIFLPLVRRQQCDQIGRNFAFWAIVYVLWVAFKNTTVAKKTFFGGKGDLLI